MTEQNTARTKPLPSLTRELKVRLSWRMAISAVVITVLASALHLGWSIHQRNGMEERLRTALAETLQEPIHSHNLINIKAILRAFSLSNQGAEICVKLAGEIILEEPRCSSPEFLDYPLNLSNDKFQVSVRLPLMDRMVWFGIPFALAILATLWLASRYLIGTVRKILEDLSLLSGLTPNGDSKNTTETSDIHFEELAQAKLKIEEGFRLQQENAKLAADAKIGAIVAQVAHDIRSPLSALEMVATMVPDLEEDKRFMIRIAIGRIRDIANDLLRRSNNPTLAAPSLGGKTDSEPRSVQLLSSLIDVLITEKRIQYRSRMGIEIKAPMEESSYGLFTEIQPNKFKRVLSNLVNNAVEALGERGEVNVTSGIENHGITIRIQDNGCGIPTHLLKRLGTKGLSVGKSEGSGLGLYHARQTIDSWGGKITIQSEPGHGTVVQIDLKLCKPPKWFTPELYIPHGARVVALDDDVSIHRIWEGRLKMVNPSIDLHHFTTADQLRNFVSSEDYGRLNDTIYLIDYELLGQDETGLDLIEDLSLANQSILVTSRHEDKTVLARSDYLSLRIIPKPLARLVPITVREEQRIKPLTTEGDQARYDQQYLD